jgi:uncharacterized protein (TIGR03435 family)
MFRFGRRGGPGTADPGRITWNNASLMDILIEAWDVKRFQVIGPDWLGTERFDIVAEGSGWSYERASPRHVARPSRGTLEPLVASRVPRCSR